MHGAGAGAVKEDRPGVARAHYQESDAPLLLVSATDWLPNGPAGYRQSLFIKRNNFVEKSWDYTDIKQLTEKNCQGSKQPPSYTRQLLSDT